MIARASPVARKKKNGDPAQGESPSSGKTTTVRLDTKLAHDLRGVSGYRGVDLSDLLYGLLRPIADQLLAELKADIAARQAGEIPGAAPTPPEQPKTKKGGTK